MITKRTFGRLALAATVAATLMACGKKEEAKPAAAPAASELTIAYITNGNTNEGWTLINGGAKKAGSVPGVKFIELAAEKGELSKQLAIVIEAMASSVSPMPIHATGFADSQVLERIQGFSKERPLL